MNLNNTEKNLIMHRVLRIIPEIPIHIDKLIPEVRLIISDNGGKNISDEEAEQLFKRMKRHGLIAGTEMIQRTVSVMDINEERLFEVMAQATAQFR